MDSKIMEESMKKHAKAAIIKSFKELLTKQCMDKITVKEICENCGVNRQTFYYYYTDIMNIFKLIIFDELSREIAQNRTFDTWEGGFLATMNYLERNSKMILHIYHSSYWPEAKSYFANLSERLLSDVVEECVDKMGVILQDKDQAFIVHFYRIVFNGLMLEWINEGMEESPQVILGKLLIMISGSIPRSIDAFVEK